MSAKTVFDSTYALLKSIGVVDTKKEFYSDEWLFLVFLNTATERL